MRGFSRPVKTSTSRQATCRRWSKMKTLLCLWANFRKSPRFKGFNFEEAGLDFKLPKQLAVRDVGVRILHTRYDHLSLLARMAQEFNELVQSIQGLDVTELTSRWTAVSASKWWT